jgi:hypothetical protein
MALAPLRVEDIVYRASNFLFWKGRVTLVLKEYDLWELVDKVVAPLTDLIGLVPHKKKEIKAERVILDLVKDNLSPHMSEKNRTKEMFYTLVGLFQSTNMNRKMVLRNRLRRMQISRSENVTSYFMRITQVCDHVAVVM